MSLKKTDARVRRGASFTRQVQAFVQTTEERANEVVRKTALGILANVVTASPVDTGHFRGNWRAGVGARPDGTVEAMDKDGGATITAAASALDAAKLGDTVYVANNLPYARRLEFGHSQQAPSGMVRGTLANLKEILGEAVGEAKQEAGKGDGAP
ncbi:HK97 gp10 family phage protein [Myxococcus sp. NMCA1]|uniref:HK97 gp10 family phage protein n=1 Tax=Myxococcus sp. NMCA1 TaxID=2996785 RepID=UPI002285DA88|nr:HK97 gp10 family phage protein [Myxococcus sp. NMCA1]WAM23824.1 HK97 gp10 family phage protein [Myxococcus sp. NMCA1]